MSSAKRILTGAAAVVLALSGCGGAGGGSADAKVDLAAVKNFLAPYEEVSPFPVTEPLTKKPAPSTHVVFLNVGTEVSKLQEEALRAATQAMGVRFTSVTTGQSPGSINKALDSVVEMKPDAVIDVAIEPSLFQSQLEKLRAAGTTVVAGSIAEGPRFGFGEAVISGGADAELAGKILVAKTLADGEGEVTEIAFYKTPELAFTVPEEKGAKEAIEQFCTGCELRVVDVPVAQVGNVAPQTIVSDLQANPGTEGAVVAFDQMQIGLPAAMKVASLDVPVVGWAPIPTNLTAIKDGQQAAALGLDTGIQMWTMLDQMAREMAGLELSPAQAKGETVKLIITKDNVPSDTTKMWTGYPDYPERFTDLWNGEG